MQLHNMYERTSEAPKVFAVTGQFQANNLTQTRHRFHPFRMRRHQTSRRPYKIKLEENAANKRRARLH